MKTISIVIPAYNEQDNLPNVFNRVNSVIDQLKNYTFEIIVIDNRSADRTSEISKKFTEKDVRWKYLRFSRNFGSEASIAAGLRFSTGDACIVLFSDLQDPPEVIPKLIQQWELGYEIAYGIYHGNDHEKMWKRYLTKVFYWLLKNISEVELVPYAGDFRLYDRRVVNVIAQMNERNRFMRGFAHWVGFKTAAIHYERQPRKAGKSSTPVFYLFGFAFSVIVNFSDKPLRLFTFIGMGVFLVSMLLALLLIGNYFFQVLPVVPGLSTTHVLLSLNLAFCAIGFGVLGEYISKIYKETKKRPIYIVDESIGVEVKNREIG